MMGELIVIDGGDGSGKATQAKLLVERIRREKSRLVGTMDFPQYKEPFYGKIIKDYLEGRYGEPTRINPMLAAMPYIMNRYAIIKELKKLMEKNAVVILDRYCTANYIHQGAKIKNEDERKTFIKQLMAIEHEILGIPVPNLVIYLHVKPEISQRLTKKRGLGRDGHESDSRYVRQVEKTSLWLCNNENWRLIECCDGSNILSPEYIHEKIFKLVNDLLTVATF